MGTEVEGGCNAYLDEQKTGDIEDGTRTTVSLVTFDTFVRVAERGKALTEMPPITQEQVRPSGSTALYDGIGQALANTVQLYNDLPEEPKVTIFILTDGHENASRVWHKESIAAEIRRLQDEHGWDFFFAAANQDAMTTGKHLAMKSTQCVTFSPSRQDIKTTFVAASKAQVRGKRGMSKSFTPAERSSCQASAKAV